MKGNSIIYQIFLRSATKDGTLKAAEKLLAHIKSLGMDIAYLCPIFEMDDDPKEEFCSDRQCYENHDSASDGYENRLERRFGKKACDAMLTVAFTSGGVPFIYNGNEIADSCRHSLWSNRFYGKNMFVDWSEALTEDGANRMELIKRLSQIYHNIPAVNQGSTEILADIEYAAVYKKVYDNQEVIVAANFSKDIKKIKLASVDVFDYTALLSARCVANDNEITLDNGGYLVLYK